MDQVEIGLQGLHSGVSREDNVPVQYTKGMSICSALISPRMRVVSKQKATQAQHWSKFWVHKQHFCAESLHSCAITTHQ